ncbi:MAG: type II secretion system F family protein [Chloroflexota bacterium]
MIAVLGIGAFLLIFGASLAVFAGGGQQVDERLEQYAGSAALLEAIEDDLDAERGGADVADRLDKMMSNRDFFTSIRLRISKADVKLRVAEYMALVVLAGAAGGLLGYYLFDGSSVMVVVGFIIGTRVLPIYVSMTANKRMKTFNNQLGDTLNLWVNALKSGYSVLQAMETIATELPPPVSKEFERVVQEVRLGLSLEQALDNMHRRVPSEDLDLVITAVNIQREVGGNLAEVLDNISFTIRERVRIKGEIQTLTAQGRISGWIISLLPIALGGFLYMINPGYISELWVIEPPYIIPNVFPCGWLVIGVGLLMIGLGAMAIRKIVDIEV